ncbi:MAG: hypothetical protein ACM3VS_12340 [Candidatus Dadabacteria bacterium]
MFDQVLNLVKEHLGNNPQVTSSIPPEQQEQVNKEVATHITQGLASQAPQQGGVGGLLSQLQAGISSGSPVTNAIEGGLIGTLTSKLGLPPMVVGAIAASLPGILQKFAQKANDPNDHSITPNDITHSLSNLGGGLGNLFNRN